MTAHRDDWLTPGGRPKASSEAARGEWEAGTRYGDLMVTMSGGARPRNFGVAWLWLMVWPIGPARGCLRYIRSACSAGT